MASELWQRIRALRKHTGLSGEAFGAELGVSKAAVSQWEAATPAKRTSPDLQKVIDMSRKFDVPLDWLLDNRSDLDLEWWLDPAEQQEPAPTLQQALHVLGEQLSGDLAPDVRQDVADALHKLAMRAGTKRDQEQVERLLAEQQALPGKRQA